MDVISKTDAIDAGEKYFFTGIQCSNSHIDKRRVSDGHCMSCARDFNKKRKRHSYMRDYHTDARRSDPERYRDNNRRWRANNLEDARRSESKSKRRFYSTTQGKAQGFIRNCLRRVFLGDKDDSSFSIIGYTSDELIKHISKTMLKGMSWDNYGEWHIDHILPISVMVKNGVTDPKVVNALTNLRAMWAFDNLSKSDKVEVLI